MVLTITLIFIVGYIAIVLEQPIRVNKAATALITAVLCWTALSMFSSRDNLVILSFMNHLGDVAGIVFFLLGAMVVVELIDAHDGFEVITQRIKTTNKHKLVWLFGIIAFILSAVLDNLTTTIVMVSLARKIIPSHRDRLLYAGLIVIAANAGGAWSPIGDVTTTMLWIGGQITTPTIILKTLLPSLVSFALPAFLISRQLKGNFEMVELKKSPVIPSRAHRNAVFLIGVGVLLFVPVFKMITHLPPFMGIFFGLGLMWLVTELMHSGKDEAEKGILSVNHALRKIDTPSILFFFGILMSIGVLESAHILSEVANWMDQKIGNINAITMTIGFLSAIVDNVPLVAAAQGMYPLNQFPTDHNFWTFLAYCAGTGGSILIIGSAAGVAAMGLEKISFSWYLKKISWLALIGYLAGAAVFILQEYL